MMNEKQVEALRLAREALERLKRAFFKDAPDSIEQWESEWVVPAMNAITAIDEALMSVSDGAQERSSEEQPAQVDPCIDGSCSCCWTHLDELPAQQQEPVGQLMEEAYGSGQVLWFDKPDDFSMLYTSPPIEATPLAGQRSVKPWQGLTYDEVAPIIQQYHWLPTAFARAIEAKLRELNEHKEKNA